MDAKQLEKYRQRLHNATPLLGAWLQRKAVEELAHDGSPKAIMVLAEAAGHQTDEQFQRLLIEAMRPWKAHQRMLFYFLTGQWEKYESLDFDHSFLRTAYETGDEQLRERIALQARRTGRVEWIEVVTGGRQKRRLGEMTNEEWNTALDMLFAGRRWEELWRLAQDAPPRWSAQILQRLNGSGWVLSKESEQEECEQLIKLALGWKEPESELSSLINCQATLQVYQGGVNCLAISPDGQLLASGSDDKTVRLWSLPDGKLLKTLEGHRDHVRCLIFSPDKRLLASGSDDKTVRLWGLPDGVLINTLEGHQNSVICVTISPDGRLLGSGSWGERWKVRLWSLPDGILINTPEGHLSSVFCLAISPNRQLLASGSYNSSMYLWTLPDGALIETLEGHQGYVKCLAISPNGQLLASGSENKTVQLWRLLDNAHLKTLEGHQGEVECLAISPDGRLLVSGSGDSTVRLWGLPDGSPLKTLGGHRGRVKYLAISPDGRLLASVSADTTVRLWTLSPIRLCNLPIMRAGLGDFEWVEETLRTGKIAESARRALEFMAALMRRRLQFDIVAEEAPQHIQASEFDIEIEG